MKQIFWLLHKSVWRSLLCLMDVSSSQLVCQSVLSQSVVSFVISLMTGYSLEEKIIEFYAALQVFFSSHGHCRCVIYSVISPISYLCDSSNFHQTQAISWKYIDYIMIHTLCYIRVFKPYFFFFTRHRYFILNFLQQ